MTSQSIQSYAKGAGILLLLSLIAGGIGEAWVPSRIIVSGDAAATANNIRMFDTLFRFGFAAYLVEAVCDVALALVFYFLLRPVRRDLALLSAFFGLVSTALFGFAELFYFAPVLLLGNPGYLKSFSPDQLSALALLSLKLYGLGGGIFMVFYGVTTILRGYLIFRSGYLPRFLGVLLGLAGVGFVANNLLLVLAPAYASDLLLAPMFLAALAMTVWFLARGINVPAWEAMMAADPN